jgi:PadR family transcriptional regulator, regulatory protein PadR
MIQESILDKLFDRELKRGTLEMVLLKLLSERQMYGYELVATLENRTGPAFKIKEGTLYPVLYRLENAGFLETRWETLDRGVPRKYYALTYSGEQQLEKLRTEWKSFSRTINHLLDVEAEGKQK